MRVLFFSAPQRQSEAKRRSPVRSPGLPPLQPHLSPFNLDQRNGRGGLRTSCIEMFNLAEGLSLHSNTSSRMLALCQSIPKRERKEGKRGRYGRGGGLSCGNHGDDLCCIIPHHGAPGDRGCPRRHSELAVLPSLHPLPDKTRSLIHDEPHPGPCNKGWGGAAIVALHFPRTAVFFFAAR